MGHRPPPTGPERRGPSPFVYHFVRLVLKAIASAYVRVRVEGRDQLPPEGPFLACFNHPSWLDPIAIAAFWPDRARRVFIFGPRERDMSVGRRNRAITWTGRGVPFQPGGADALDATRRAVAVLRGGDALVVAGEGRLSDHEGSILPLEPGVAHFATLAGVPVVPLAVIGTRWVHFRSHVTLRFGPPLFPRDFPRGKAGMEAMSAALGERLSAMLEGVPERQPPGRFGAWISELYNDRPWLEEAEARSTADKS